MYTRIIEKLLPHNCYTQQMTEQYGGDQYRVDYESRYPTFSDYQVSDAAIAEHNWDRPARSRKVHSYESKYQTEQMGIPTYLGCTCGSCPSSEWPKHKPMRRCSIEDREQAMDGAFERRCHADAPKQAPAPAVGDGTEKMLGGMLSGPSITMDQNTIMIVLMFIMIVFICCFCIKSLTELKAQIKSLKEQTESLKREVK